MSTRAGQPFPVACCAVVCCCFCAIALSLALVVALSSDAASACFDAPATLNTTLNTTRGTNATAAASTCAGSRVAVGVGGAGDGFVEVYELDDGDGAYTNSQLLMPPNASMGGAFGAAIATDCTSGWLAVGEPAGAALAGRAHVYRLQDGVYELLTTLENPAAPDTSQFGASLAFACQRPVLAVGAPEAGGGIGAVWLYRLNATGARLEQVLIGLVTSNISFNSAFGSAVAVACDGTTVAVGAPNDDGGRGAVLVYDAPSLDSNVTLNDKIVGSEPGAEAGSSLAVVTRGGVLVVGEPGSSASGGALAGAGGAWLVERTSLDTHARRFRFDGATAGERFGHRVAAGAGGRAVVVSAWSDSNEPGRVVRYGCSSTSVCAVDQTLSFDDARLLGNGAALSYAGSIVVAASAALDENSTRVGVVGCSGRTSLACPVC